MSLAYGKVATAALELPFKGRVKLAERLLLSLDEPDEAEVSRLWTEEAERRFKDYKAGKAKPVDGAKVLARLKSRLA